MPGCTPSSSKTKRSKNKSPVWLPCDGLWSRLCTYQLWDDEPLKHGCNQLLSGLDVSACMVPNSSSSTNIRYSDREQKIACMVITAPWLHAVQETMSTGGSATDGQQQQQQQQEELLRQIASSVAVPRRAFGSHITGRQEGQPTRQIWIPVSCHLLCLPAREPSVLWLSE
jgi:hypothetical protein